MLKLKNIDIKIENILKKYKIYFSDVDVIGGGFIRDILSGREWKDIDVFCGMDAVPKRILRPTEFIEENYSVSDRDLPFSHEERHIHNGYGFAIDFKFLDEAPTPQDIAKLHQLNLCQCAWSREAGLYVSSDFLGGFEDKVIAVDDSITNWNEGTSRSQAHIIKMQRYYPDFSVDEEIEEVVVSRDSEYEEYRRELSGSRGGS